MQEVLQVGGLLSSSRGAVDEGAPGALVRDLVAHLLHLEVHVDNERCKDVMETLDIQLLGRGG